MVSPIGIALVMLRMNDVVIRLRKAARDRFDDTEEAIQQRRAKERVVDEVVRDTVDVRIDHERIDEAETQHDPERCMRVEQEHAEKQARWKNPATIGKMSHRV